MKRLITFLLVISSFWPSLVWGASLKQTDNWIGYQIEKLERLQDKVGEICGKLVPRIEWFNNANDVLNAELEKARAYLKQLQASLHGVAEEVMKLNWTLANKESELKTVKMLLRTDKAKRKKALQDRLDQIFTELEVVEVSYRVLDQNLRLLGKIIWKRLHGDPTYPLPTEWGIKTLEEAFALFDEWTEQLMALENVIDGLKSEIKFIRQALHGIAPDPELIARRDKLSGEIAALKPQIQDKMRAFRALSGKIQRTEVDISRLEEELAVLSDYDIPETCRKRPLPRPL